MNEPGVDLNQLMKLASTRGQRLGPSASPALWYYPANRSKAQTLLLLHGFRGDHHGLLAIAGALPDFNVLVPDLPGYGKSAALGVAHTIENYADWLVEYHSQLKKDFGPINVVAHSFGTQVLSSALTKGLKPKSVTMLNPISEVASSSSSFAKQLTGAVYTLATKLGIFGSALLRSWLAVQLMSSSLALTKNKSLRRQIHQQHHRYFSNYVEDRVIVEAFSSANAYAVQPSSLPSGTLLVVGEKDIIAPMKGQLQLVAGREDLKLIVLDEAGHLVHYENPIEVAELIRSQVLSASKRAKISVKK